MSISLDQAELHGSLSDPLLATMNFLNEVTSRFPEAISFAPGRPYEGLFEPDLITTYLAAYTAYLETDLGYTPAQVRTNLFQYGRTNGHIHDLIARTLANDEGLAVSPASIVVTVGCQEGMLLVLRALFSGPDDVLLVSSPCYVGITGAARLLDIEIVEVPEGKRGVEPAALARAARLVRAAGKRPRAFYVVPDFANPTGACLATEDRRALIEAAADAELLVLEDNPYGFFSRDGTSLPTMKSLDQDRRVIYLGSFAKTCLPGARVGYVIADQEVVLPNGSRVLLADELSKIKSFTTVNTSALSQALIGGLLVANGCRLREANESAIRFYANNLTVLLDELERRFPADRRAELGVRWNKPDGGFFLVLDVDFTADNAALERSATEYGVLWTPMSYFHLEPGGRTQIRVSVSYLNPDQVIEGVRRLAAFIAAESAISAKAA
ncbi:aminotransferase-like domain-containing protein [Actinokineospora sp.]|uniref:aminotransferase-like domain-containing protein n=1 Tax=Actinokineospora sp. TaxID=1872133 RepID=UPI0040378B15